MATSNAGTCTHPLEMRRWRKGVIADNAGRRVETFMGTCKECGEVYQTLLLTLITPINGDMRIAREKGGVKQCQ